MKDVLRWITTDKHGVRHPMYLVARILTVGLTVEIVALCKVFTSKLTRVIFEYQYNNTVNINLITQLEFLSCYRRIYTNSDRGCVLY